MAELKRLDAQGFRGVRFNYLQHLGGGPQVSEVMKLSSKLASLGWHLQLHLEANMVVKMVGELGQRVLWGSDWPHPNLEAIPDDGLLVDLIAEFADEMQRRALLVENPQRLYKFTS